MKQIHNVILDNFREITLYNMDEGTDDDSPQSEPVFLSCHEIICFFKPYSIGLSPWCHGYDYEYYTTTTQSRCLQVGWSAVYIRITQLQKFWCR